MNQLLIKFTVGLVTLICWGMTIYKFRDVVRDRRNAPLRALWIALATITLSLTVQPIAPLLDQLAGIVDFGRVLSNCLTLISAAAAQAFLFYMSSEDDRTTRRVRVQYLIMATAVCAVVVLYALNPPSVDVGSDFVKSGQFYNNGTPPSGATPYTWVYLAYLAWSMVQVARLSTRYARITTRPLLRGGLRLITVGALLGLLYVALKVVSAVLNRRDGVAAAGVDRALIVSFTVSILLILIGSTVPSWGPLVRLDRLVESATASSACRRLRPLWNVITDAAPSIRVTDRLGEFPGTARLVRMTLEILDGYALLRPWMSGAVAERARQQAALRGVSGERLEAVAEAALLVAAIEAYRRSDPHAEDGDLVVAPARTGQADDPATAVSWLTLVAQSLPEAHTPAAAPAAGSAVR